MRGGAGEGRPDVVRVLAPAKVNPHLAVLGRRPDGYHELDTTMLAIELCDVLEVRLRERPGVELDVHGPQASADVPLDASNLVWRAAERVLSLAGGGAAAAGVALRLEKRIPSRAGLGGGSSDAAAAAVGVRRALGSELGDAELARVLSELGSDCAFFVLAGNTGHARCTGRGEIVRTLPVDERIRSVVVLTPALESPTAAVYRALAESLSARERAPTVADVGLADAGALRALRNDLEEPALRVVEGLSAWRELLDRSGGSHFRLSGSGSSFFGLFHDAPRARRASEFLAAAAAREGLALRGCWVVPPAGFGTRILDPHPR